MAALAAELRTAHLPPVAFSTDDVSAGGEAPWFLSWLRPELRVTTPFGAWTRAPYGSPGASTWPALAVVAGLVVLAVLALAVVGVFSLVRGR